MTVWLKKSKFTNFRRPQLDFSIFLSLPSPYPDHSLQIFKDLSWIFTFLRLPRPYKWSIMPSKLSKTSKASSKPVWEAPYLCGQSLQIFWSAKLPPRCCSNRAGWFRDFSASSKESTRLLKNSSASCCSRKFTGSPHNLLKKEVISGCARRCWQVSVSPHEETLKKQVAK